MTFKRPILAAPLMPSGIEHTDGNILDAMKKLTYPVGATLKLDGIRAIRLNGSLVSRTLKPIPNKKIRNASIILPAGFDCELWSRELSYCEIESIVMSREHPDWEKIKFHVLDWYADDNFNYHERMVNVAVVMRNFSNGQVKFVPPIICHNAEQLFSFFLSVEQEAGEGICFRKLYSPYKQGRSTLREQFLVKLARFSYEEATIIGFTEQMENGNPDKRNGTGMMDRSKDSGNMIGKGTLGSLIVENKSGQQFSIGTGFSDKLRHNIWDNRTTMLNKQITYKCKRHGEKLLPRSPVFHGFRKEGF